MRTSEKRVILSVAVLAALLILAELLMGFLLTPSKSYTRLMLHDLYENADTAEVIVAGASHPQHAVDPSAMEGMAVMNISSASQSVLDSYYMLREALRVSDPDIVALELTAGMYTTFNGYDNPTSSFILYDYMRLSPVKLSYGLAAFDAADYPDVYLRSCRYRDNLTLDFVSSNVAAKLTEAWRSFSPDSAVNETERYGGLGFVYAGAAVENGFVGRVAPFKWERRIVNAEAVAYLARIAALCRAEGVELVLFTAPMPYASLAAMGDYEDAHAFFAELAADNGAVYLDFNLVRESVFCRQDEDFYDDTHMTGAAAARFSAVLAEALEDPAAFASAAKLYASYADMTADLARIWNVWLTSSVRGDTVSLSAASLAAAGVEVEYRISVTVGGETAVLLDFGGGNACEYAMTGGSAGFTVEARQPGGETEQSWRLTLEAAG